MEGACADNPAALQDLFVHYMDAWKSWYSEVAEKKPYQQVS